MNNQNTTQSNPINEEILEELKREFMLEMELGYVREKSGFQVIRWKNEEKSFDDLADFVLKALQAKDEQYRQEKIELVEGAPKGLTLEEINYNSLRIMDINEEIYKAIRQEERERAKKIIEEMKTGPYKVGNRPVCIECCDRIIKKLNK